MTARSVSIGLQKVAKEKTKPKIAVKEKINIFRSQSSQRTATQ